MATGPAHRQLGDAKGNESSLTGPIDGRIFRWHGGAFRTLRHLRYAACVLGRPFLPSHRLSSDAVRSRLLARGRLLELVTLGWNVVGVVVLAVAAVSARSVALAGFGLDSLIEIAASTVVLWELAGAPEDRQRRAMRLIGASFIVLALYLAAQSTVVLVVAFHPHPSLPGIAWTGATAIAMFALAAGKAKTGAALGNPVLQTEGKVTLVDGILASAVLVGLVLNAALGWWWADPAAGYVLVYYGAREAHHALTS